MSYTQCIGFKIGDRVRVTNSSLPLHLHAGNLIAEDVDGRVLFKCDRTNRKGWMSQEDLQGVPKRWTPQESPQPEPSPAANVPETPDSSVDHSADATQMLDEEYREPCVLDLNNGLIPVEVRDSHDRPWETRTLTAVGHPDASYRFSTEDAFDGGTALGHWKHARIKRAPANHCADANKMVDSVIKESLTTAPHIDRERIADTVESYARIVRSDNDLAWTIFCNLAMMAYDAGAPIAEANERSADLMKHWFDFEIRESEWWSKTKPPANHCADANKMVDQVAKESLTTATPVPGPRKTILYIAGPMRGVAWFNYPLFDRVARELREAGHEVISPADEDRDEDDFNPFTNPAYADGRNCTFPEHLDFEKIVRRCLEAVLRCDEIVLLPGWERSKGAIAELALAMWLGIPVQFCSPSLHEGDRYRPSIYVRQGRVGIGIETFAHNLYHSWFVCNIGIDDTECDEPECDDCQTYTEHLAATQDDEDVLDEAARITRGNRSASYGPPDQDFRRTAGMWSALFAAKLKDGVTFEPRDVALAMILLKTSRETHQRKRDNWVDIAGYARCGSLCQ